MSVSTVYTSKVTSTEKLGDTYLSSNQNSVVHNGLDTSSTLNSGSTPAVSVVVSNVATLSSGAYTIDLRNLVGTNGGATDLNGMKVRLIKLRGKSGNANPITVTPGASNGYELFGASSSVSLAANCEVLLYVADTAPSVDSTHKTLDLAGTGSQQLEYTIVAG